MTKIVTVTLEELGLKAKVKFTSDIGNYGYRHKDVVEAFKANGLTPITSVDDLYQVVFHAQNSYIPDKDFFKVEVPDCPYMNSDEFFRGSYLEDHGGWPPNAAWILLKE
ncbi:hypothetical protein K2P47_00170 [Patescibacteria group bacterium]|nr:hypothetical protein [Patescibacteria group bacterium]